MSEIAAGLREYRWLVVVDVLADAPLLMSFLWAAESSDWDNRREFSLCVPISCPDGPQVYVRMSKPLHWHGQRHMPLRTVVIHRAKMHRECYPEAINRKRVELVVAATWCHVDRRLSTTTNLNQCAMGLRGAYHDHACGVRP